MKTRGLLTVFAAAMAAFAVAACGDDDDATGTQAQASATSASTAQPTAAATTSPAADAEKAALLESINEEYKAHATYQAVIDKFGDVTPFSTIVKSEQNHIDAWKTLLTRYGIAIAQDPFLGKLTAPASLKDACLAGVSAEKEDVALYDRLLKTVTSADITSVMQQQRQVSQDNHLPAFERC
jgi:hypothetical protein